MTNSYLISIGLVLYKVLNMFQQPIITSVSIFCFVTSAILILDPIYLKINIHTVKLLSVLEIYIRCYTVSFSLLARKIPVHERQHTFLRMIRIAKPQGIFFVIFTSCLLKNALCSSNKGTCSHDFTLYN